MSSKHCSLVSWRLGAIKIAQKAKTFWPQFSPKAHMVEGENQLLNIVF